jgi:hypothetical protein
VGELLVTSANYFAPEARKKYMGASQLKAFMECEAAALAEVNGEYEREKTTSLLVGSFVDAYFSGTMDEFMAENPNVFTKKGELKSDYRRAEEIIARIERDPFMMKYLSGQKQFIMTGEIEGVPFKIKIDSYHAGRVIVDLKVVKDFEPIWKKGQGKLSFAEAWKYDLQGSIYQEIERQNSGTPLPFFLAAATKEPVTNIDVISISQPKLDAALTIVKALAPHFNDIKQGIIPATRCEKCDYCKSTKVLTRVVDLDEFTGGIDHE